MSKLTHLIRLIPLAFAILALMQFGDPGFVSAESRRDSVSDSINFNRDIRPLLSDKCFHCHGPDTNHREAGLRLDLAESALESAIVAGTAEESEVFQRLISDDVDLKMPPPESNKSLSAAEIDLIRRWIDRGAKYEQHWAFIPPRSGPPPKVSRDDWVRNPIDTFVLAKLERERLAPSRPADRQTLLRRVTLDLTGLPARESDLDAFLNDKSPDAYERVVDRLLASESYGERLAQNWLDAARFADTMGYQADWERYQWRWRGWVIDALNQNLPFDQFTIEQLAGDLLPDPSVEQLIATGFNRNHRINDEGGIIPEEYLVEYVVDRVETTSGTWMGLTMGCARCHDHKFDPLSQVDFYRLYAFFNAVPEKGKEGRLGYANPYMRVARRGKQQEYESRKKRLADKEAELKKLVASLKPSREKWTQEMESKLAATPRRWAVALPTRLEIENGAGQFDRLEDQSYLVSGSDLQHPTYALELTPAQRSISGLKIEALTDPSHHNGSLSPVGNFILTDFTVEWLPADPGKARREKKRRVKIAEAKADYQQRGYPARHAIDKDKQTGWGVDGHVKKETRTIEFSFGNPIDLSPGDRLCVRMAFEQKHPQRVMGRFRLSLGNAAADDLGLPVEVADALRKTAPRRTTKQNKLVADYHARIAPETKSIRDELKSERASFEEFEKLHATYVMVMREMDQPRHTYVLSRGVYDQPGEQVNAGVPSHVLGDLPRGAPANRLGLAQWLVSGQHPLTARVIVNRYWAMLFGRGLVETVEDFGLQGAFPSHPELLDWLATEYPRIGWDTKRLLKLMVTSATYRQSSNVTSDKIASDPENRLLARMSRLRLPAEMIRDQALSASGMMVRRIGGPSVKPYQPDGLWKDLSFQDKKRSTDFYELGAGSDLYRRSIYTFWKRSVPPPTMATFDAPSREMCTLRRSRTNTPLQALALMNDTTYVEASRILASLALSRSGNQTERIRFVFRKLLSRDPDSRERSVLSRGLQRRRDYFADHIEAARALISQGQSEPGASHDPVELAAMTTCVMTVMNLDETVNRE